MSDSQAKLEADYMERLALRLLMRLPNGAAFLTFLLARPQSEVHLRKKKEKELWSG
jgi:hypothetical protein